jgi:hypothetical protein
MSVPIKEERVADEGPDLLDGDAEFVLAQHENADYYDDGGFRIKRVGVPTIVNRTVKDLHSKQPYDSSRVDSNIIIELSQTKYLKLDPEYQRDVVWDETRASGLIRSLIRKSPKGYYFCLLYYARLTSDKRVTLFLP